MGMRYQRPMMKLVGRGQLLTSAVRQGCLQLGYGCMCCAFPMLTRLIVNADDLGITRGVNRAIGELYRTGVLTSATLMASGTEFEDAVAMAHAHAGLGVGCHVVLTDGVPLSPPETIRSLLGKAVAGQARLRSSLGQFARAALLGQLDEAEIEREAEMQITRVLDAGIRPTHVDTHKHTHLFPVVLRAVLRAAERLGVPAIRNPFEPPWAMRQGHGDMLRRLQMRTLDGFEQTFLEQPALQDGNVQTTDGAIGISATGELNHAALASMLAVMPAGTWELVCHPGYDDADLGRVRTRLRAERDVERQALLAVLSTRRANAGFQLVSFGDLATVPKVAGAPRPRPDATLMEGFDR